MNAVDPLQVLCVAIKLVQKRVTAPKGAQFTERQRLLLEEPPGAHWFFPSLFDDESARLKN
ncbi:MAG: hypothetical protein CM1200mP9_10440 [Gammaproteobacteria bacterium]|nr:MAG: hypothetical protein CM1200mP9_10440 [Gammaproteobacteria bacterium]